MVVSRNSFGLALALSLSLASWPSALAARMIVGAPQSLPSCKCYYANGQSLAVLDDGSFAVARRAAVASGTRGWLEVVFFRSGGTAIGAPVVIVGHRTNDHYVSVGAYGNWYLVTWSRIGSGKASAAFFDATGRRLGHWFSWPYSDLAFPSEWLHFASGSQGWVLAFFGEVGGFDRFHNPYYLVRAQVAGPPSGSFLGPPVLLTGRSTIFLPEDASITESGRFVTVGRWCPINPRSTQECVLSRQLFQSPWKPKSAVLTEGMPDPDHLVSRYSVAMKPNGEFALASVQQFGGGFRDDDRVMTRFFGREGRPAGEVVQISDPETHSGAGPLIRALPYGSFAVVWINTPDFVSNDVHIREVDPVSGALGPRVPLAQNANLYAYGFEVNAHGQGVVLVGNHVTLVQFVPDEDRSSPAEGGRP